MARRPQPALSQIPSSTERTTRPFAYALPSVAATVLPNRTELEALMFPQTKPQFEVGILLLADEVAAVPTEAKPYSPRGYAYDALVRHHVAADLDSWQEERTIMEPLLLQWIWNTICTHLAKVQHMGQRVVFGGMPGISVGGESEVTGRVQISARAYVALEPKRGPDA